VPDVNVAKKPVWVKYSTTVHRATTTGWVRQKVLRQHDKNYSSSSNQKVKGTFQLKINFIKVDSDSRSENLHFADNPTRNIKFKTKRIGAEQPDNLQFVHKN
jgi:hypothetical protein